MFYFILGRPLLSKYLTTPFFLALRVILTMLKLHDVLFSLFLLPDQSIYQCMYLFIYAVWNNLRDLDGQVINYAESITNFKKAFNTAYELS